jgi:hypothetical protein
MYLKHGRRSNSKFKSMQLVYVTLLQMFYVWVVKQVQWLTIALQNGPTFPYFYLKTEIFSSSNVLFFFRTSDGGHSPENLSFWLLFTAVRTVQYRISTLPFWICGIINNILHSKMFFYILHKKLQLKGSCSCHFTRKRHHNKTVVAYMKHGANITTLFNH